MNKSKIEWCDYTWNPVTGCLRGCPYCYAQRIARRFCHDPWNTVENEINHFVGLPMQNEFYKGGRVDPYPYGFDPTFHRYRLEEPQKIKKSSKIFVVSMGDLFGDWVPNEWIEEVFKTCEKAPQHTYLFLTKNPKRYLSLESHGKLPNNFWYGTTITDEYDAHTLTGAPYRTKRFLSIEPLSGSIKSSVITDYNWIIIGAETGYRKGKVLPKPEWIQSIIDQARLANVPLFLKNNLHYKEKIQGFPF